MTPPRSAPASYRVARAVILLTLVAAVVLLWFAYGLDVIEAVRGWLDAVGAWQDSTTPW